MGLSEELSRKMTPLRESLGLLLWTGCDLRTALDVSYANQIYVDLAVVRAPALGNDLEEEALQELATALGQGRIIVVCNNSSHHSHFLRLGAVCTEAGLVEALAEHFAAQPAGLT